MTKLKATVMWANLNHVNEMSGKYQIDLSNLSTKAVEELAKEGIEARESTKAEDERGVYITCKSTYPIPAYYEDGSEVPSNIKIGKHFHANLYSYVEHDCVIDDFVHISPNASVAGNVKVGEGTQIGMGATVIQGITIGKWAVVGAGTVIIENVPDYAVVVGVPGKTIKFISNNELKINF